MELCKNMSNKEQLILESVLELARSGADLRALRIQEIADKAGIGKGTVYEYYRSKDEILQNVIVYCFEKELEEIEEHLGGCTSFEETLQASLDYIKEVIRERAASYLLVSRAMSAPKEGTAQFLSQVTGRFQTILEQIHAMGIARGEIRSDVTLTYFTYTVSTALMGFAGNLGRLMGDCKEGLLGTAEEIEEYTRTMIRRSVGA